MCGVPDWGVGEDLVGKAKNGDRESFEFILKGLEGYQKSLCRKFFMPGADKEDLEQEALYGLAQAIRDFQPARGIEFRDYAMLRMRNSVVASVRKATRKKQQVLSEASSLEPAMTPCCNRSLPESVVTDRSFLRALFESLKRSLSELELSALLGRAEGVPVREIAAALSIREKTVENALFRARKKAKRATLTLA